MADENIFGNEPPKTPEGVVLPPNQPVLPDSVKELVGEGKKYATVEKALEALVPAQAHIATLEQELKALRERAENVVSVEQLHETVQELLRKEAETRQPGAVDEAAISGLLDRALTQREQAALAKSNQDAVVTALRDKYGDKAQEQYEAKAKELGLSVAELNLLARKSSTAVLKYFDGVKVPAVPARPGTSVNTDAFAHNKQPLEKPKSPMYGGTTKDIDASWQYAKSKVMNRLKQE